MSKLFNILLGLGKEGLLLTTLAVVGLGGIVFLQVARQGKTSRSEAQSLLQNQGQEAQVGADAARKMQKIEGELWRTSDSVVEAGRPFIFKLKRFSPGATYELEISDGTRKPFIDGVLPHTFKHGGRKYVSLYAQYEGKTLKVDSMRVLVTAHAPIKEAVSKAVDF